MRLGPSAGQARRPPAVPVRGRRSRCAARRGRPRRARSSRVIRSGPAAVASRAPWSAGPSRSAVLVVASASLVVVRQSLGRASLAVLGRASDRVASSPSPLVVATASSAVAVGRRAAGADARRLPRPVGTRRVWTGLHRAERRSAVGVRVAAATGPPWPPRLLPRPSPCRGRPCRRRGRAVAVDVPSRGRGCRRAVVAPCGDRGSGEPWPRRPRRARVPARCAAVAGACCRRGARSAPSRGFGALGRLRACCGASPLGSRLRRRRRRRGGARPVTAEVTGPARTVAVAGTARATADGGRSRVGQLAHWPLRSRSSRTGTATPRRRRSAGSRDDVDEALGAERVAEDQAAGEGQHDAGEQGPTVLGVHMILPRCGATGGNGQFPVSRVANHVPRARDANGPDGPCRLAGRPTLRRTSSSSPRPRAGPASG